MQQRQRGRGAGDVKDRSAEVTALWAAYPDSADWDMTIGGVVGQSKPTGKHNNDFTIYLTTFSSKVVPGFTAYQTIDVPNGDSMDFENRVTSFFEVVTKGSLSPGLAEPESFMQWYAAKMAMLGQRLERQTRRRTWWCRPHRPSTAPYTSTLVLMERGCHRRPGCR